MGSYRNLALQQIDFADGINVFVGGNGQGKTNVLESVYLLATLRSFRSASTKNVIQHGSESAFITAGLTADEIPQEIKIVIEKNGRKVWMGRRCVKSASDYLGVFKVIAFTPDDLAMIKGGPSIRRRFLDGSVFLFKPSHLLLLREFNTALHAYNKLIKAVGRCEEDVLDCFGRTMARCGAKLSTARRDLVEKLSYRAEEIMHRLNNHRGDFSLVFKPGWKWNAGLEPEESLYEQIRTNTNMYRARGHCLHGSQQDDFELLLDGKPARWFGSQGQQKSCALALLMAVVDESLEQGFNIPVILLDDISSELDSQRRSALFEMVAAIGGQVFITATETSLISDIIGRAARRFEVRGGNVLPE